MKIKNGEECFTTGEVASMFGVHPQTIRRWVAKLKCGRKWSLLSRSQIKQMCEQNSVTPKFWFSDGELFLGSCDAAIFLGLTVQQVQRLAKGRRVAGGDIVQLKPVNRVGDKYARYLKSQLMAFAVKYPQLTPNAPINMESL